MVSKWFVTWSYLPSNLCFTLSFHKYKRLRSSLSLQLMMRLSRREDDDKGSAELQKAADMAKISLLFFSDSSNFWAMHATNWCWNCRWNFSPPDEILLLAPSPFQNVMVKEAYFDNVTDTVSAQWLILYSWSEVALKQAHLCCCWVSGRVTEFIMRCDRDMTME